ncbi:MAG: hypothetical protein HY074_08395 [Deltaproteobacteria bacterium]|nr:hypothetical protein [Deltaproteobacteria bacterium]
MNKVLVNLAILFSVVIISAKAATAQDFKPVLLVQEPEHVFTPMGFDDNDNVQMVLHGYLSDTCHKTGPVYTRVDKEHKTIYVRNTVYFYSGCWCAAVLTPYLQTLNLGLLGVGSYDVVVEKPDGTFQKMAALPVAVAKTPSPDDYLYAPVDHLHFTQRQAPQSSEITLSGVFRNSCMTLKDVKVTYRPNHVVEVQPIAEMDTTNCTIDAKPFEATVKINPAYRGTALIHVRSLNGQSLNQVVDL